MIGRHTQSGARLGIASCVEEFETVTLLVQLVIWYKGFELQQLGTALPPPPQPVYLLSSHVTRFSKPSPPFLHTVNMQLGMRLGHPFAFWVFFAMILMYLPSLQTLPSGLKTKCIAG